MSTSATLVYAWTTGGKRHRLVARAKHTAIYRDTMLLECCEIDALGGDRWVTIKSWTGPDGGAPSVDCDSTSHNALVSALDAALLERDATRRDGELLRMELAESQGVVRNLCETSPA